MIKTNTINYNSEDKKFNVNGEVALNDVKSYQFIPFECLVSFIIDHCKKVNDLESPEFRRFMISDHIIIEFYGIKYYLSSGEYNTKNKVIYDYLISNYKLN